MKKVEALSNFFRHVGYLKKIERTGWVLRGIKNPESVADHSFRAAVITLVLADSAGVDKNKAVQMALIHELAESVIGDLTKADGISADQKHARELEVFVQVCSDIPNGIYFISLFKEYVEGKTDVAKFVKQAETFEMMLQAREYGLQQPDADLEDFWKGTENFDFGSLQTLYRRLRTISSAG